MPNDRGDLPNRVSYRRPGWNYASVGWYFITVCVKDRICCLGEVIDGANVGPYVRLSPPGKIVLDELMQTQFLRPYVNLDTFVIMPNHVHFLVEIHTEPSSSQVPGTQLSANSMSVIIGQWKAMATMRIRREIDSNFAWHDRFYDIILWHDFEIERVRAYIQDNPKEWYRDRNKPSGVYM